MEQPIENEIMRWANDPMASVNEPKDLKGQLFNLLTRSKECTFIFSKRLEATEVMLAAFYAWRERQRG
jgi:hypothetical protein